MEAQPHPPLPAALSTTLAGQEGGWAPEASVDPLNQTLNTSYYLYFNRKNNVAGRIY
jgi:hypothetical protein